MMKAKIHIENLKCHGCANTIRKNLETLEGVDEVLVNVEESAVCITWEGDTDRSEEFQEILSKLGYPPQGKNSPGKIVKSYVSCAIGRVSKKN